MRNNDTTAQYKLDTTSHLDANHNRVVISGAFKAMQAMGVSKQTSIKVLHGLKDRIRERDDQPAAWFYGPTRATWVNARFEAGEFEGQPHEVLGRAFRGEAA